MSRLHCFSKLEKYWSYFLNYANSLLSENLITITIVYQNHETIKAKNTCYSEQYVFDCFTFEKDILLFVIEMKNHARHLLLAEQTDILCNLPDFFHINVKLNLSIYLYILDCFTSDVVLIILELRCPNKSADIQH